MLDDLAGDLALELVEGLMGLAAQEMSARLRRRLARLRRRERVRIGCSVRHARGWRSGALFLVIGTGATWRPRWGQRVIELPKGVTPVRWRVARRFTRLRKRAILTYRMTSDTIELAVRPKDLVLLGRVLRLPAR